MSQLSYIPLSDGDKPLAAGFNSRLLLAVNLLNAGIESDNIAAGAVTDAKISQITSASKVNGSALYSLASIPSGAGVIPSVNLPASSVVPNYRTGMYVMQASATTITVAPGSVEINSTVVSKVANTTLTLTTAGDWAGGTSLQATTTTGYVIIDANGNLKMTTTPPAYADYALTINAANNTKRYASVSSLTYRYLGWFYMNATGSGQLDTFGVSNLADGGVRNIVTFQTGTFASGSTGVTFNNSIPTNSMGDPYMSQVFRPTNVNNKLIITTFVNGVCTGTTNPFALMLFQDSTANALSATIHQPSGGNYPDGAGLVYEMKAGTISATTFKIRAGGASTFDFNGAGGVGFFGGVLSSFIKVEEIESQLT